MGCGAAIASEHYLYITTGMKLLPHTSRLTLHALAGAQAAWQRRTACPHACCCTCRKYGVKPSDAGRCTGCGTRGACPCEEPLQQQHAQPIADLRQGQGGRPLLTPGGFPRSRTTQRSASTPCGDASPPKWVGSGRVTLRHVSPIPPLGRVENWRAYRRWRVSSPTLSLVGWVHSSTIVTFPAPATSNAACGFP